MKVNIATNLRYLMAEKNIDMIKTLAKETGIKIDTLYKYFDKEILPSVPNLLILCDYFKCSADFILGRCDDEEITGKKTDTPFIENFNYLLKINNIKSYSACKDMGINRCRVVEWKKGVMPRIRTLLLIADYFDTKVDFLLGRTDEF